MQDSLETTRILGYSDNVGGSVTSVQELKGMPKH